MTKIITLLWGCQKKVRQSVFKRDGNICQYCKGNSGNKRLVVDHIIPKNRGGNHEMENLITSCNSCNSKKGNKTLIEWIKNEKVTLST